MILFIPANRACPDKSTRYPVTDINPMLWVKTENPDYTVISLDGFIVTDQKKVNGIFKKLEFIAETPDEEILLAAISSILLPEEIKLIKDFATALNCKFYIFIWPKNFPQGYAIDAKLIHSYTFSFAEGKLVIDTHKRISIKDLESGIARLRGYSFPAGKEMKAASSNVECYLANKTKNPWPGDIDTLVYDQVQQKYLAIIEFKTHNIDTPVSEEHIGKYGQEDWRRFNVLFDLTDNFDQMLGYRPRLFYIVWGSNGNTKNHAHIKIDVLERNRVVQSSLFPRPAYQQFSAELFRFILKECQ